LSCPLDGVLERCDSGLEDHRDGPLVGWPLTVQDGVDRGGEVDPHDAVAEIDGAGVTVT